MKISPLPASGMPMAGAAEAAPSPPTMAQRIRSVRMNTNATPGKVEPLPQDPLAIPDTEEGATEATQPLSPQFAALAKQRRALQVKERELADREKAVAERTGTQPGAIDLARLKSDPLGVLLESGVTYEQLTEAVLANQDGVNPKIQALEAKIAALESGVDKKLTDRDAQQEQQVLADMHRTALTHTAQGRFPFVKAEGAEQAAVDICYAHYKKTGVVNDIEWGLQEANKWLEADYRKKAALLDLSAPVAQPPTFPPPQQQRQMRTLTNRDTAQVPMSAKQRALAAFQGTLKR